MKVFKMKLWTFLMLAGVFMLISSCENDGQMDCNPVYNISVSVNLNLPSYHEVETRGWAYVDGEGTGSKGLILVRTNNGYKAYDRNAPHICPNANSRLEVVDDIKLYCPYDGAEWMLATGQPIKIADRAPRIYTAVRVGDIVEIHN